MNICMLERRVYLVGFVCNVDMFCNLDVYISYLVIKICYWRAKGRPMVDVLLFEFIDKVSIYHVCTMYTDFTRKNQKIQKVAS